MTAIHLCGFKSYLRDHGYARVQYYLKKISEFYCFLGLFKAKQVTENE